MKPHRCKSPLGQSILRICANKAARSCAAALALGGTLAHTPAARANVTVAQVEAAIDKGKEFIYSQMKGDNWETMPPPTGQGQDAWGLAGQYGGQTAIAIYTLLATGESYQEPRLKKAINWLGNQNKMTGIYAVGLRANVWNQIDIKLRKKPPYTTAINRDMEILLGAVKTKNPQVSGMYNYFKEPSDRIDHSVSQYGVLGMWAVADSEIGVEIDNRYWKVVEEGWKRDQDAFDVQNFVKKPDAAAGWGYDIGQPHGKATASMTAAGVASLFITQDQLHFSEGVDCRGNIFNPHIEAGINWLAANFAQVNSNYTWYGIERIGVASGRKYFGAVDWFKNGATGLVAAQQPNGSWPPAQGSPVADTCFALMFLERGHAPVLMNKLQYSIFTNGDTHKEAAWNQRARDAANLAKHVGKQTEAFLNWQIVNLNGTPEDLHDAPILYIAGGKEGLYFSPEQEAKLKKFVDEGGLILGNADCGSMKFASDFKKLGTKLFANEFRKLEPTHLIYTENGPSAKAFSEIQGLSNGARELMLLFPSADPARFWQTGSYSGKEQFHNVAMNVFLYTTEKLKPRTKLETYIVNRDATPAARSIKVARLKFDAAEQIWNPEPYGWVRLGNILHNREKVDVTAEPVELGQGKLDPKVYKVAHMTGVYTFNLKPTAEAELKTYLSNGGTLIIDACGGSPKFALSAESLLAKLFPGKAPKELPLDSPAYHAGSVKIDAAAYRPFAFTQIPKGHKPRVSQIAVNGRPAVLFSREDLSVGLVGQTVDGIVGYAPQPSKDKDGKFNGASAADVMGSLVLFAGSDGGAVAAAPAGEKK